MQEVNQELAIKHGLTADEYNKIVELMGRNPNLVELGIFSAMWNEHCSYKSSRIWLQTLPTKNKYVIQGPGENAGVVDFLYRTLSRSSNWSWWNIKRCFYNGRKTCC
jgi:phosphoribosylformylglycinamidine (FGAM) synthase-like enzyme